jgi:transposase
MSRVKYSDICGGEQRKYMIRVEMAQRALAEGVKRTAAVYGTTAKTVRKWRDRYREEGVKGLKDRSRRPKRSPGRVPRKLEKLVIRLREQYPTWGGRRLVERFELPCSPTTVYSILKRHGAYKPRKKRWRQKRDLREQKKRLGPLEKVQFDLKHLTDINEYYRGLKAYDLPRYEYTARDVRTGMVVVAFAYEASLTNAVTFARYVGRHFQSYGGELKNKLCQTDNGSEFVGGPKAKRPSAFTAAVEGWGAKHVRIPPRMPTCNSDVEAFHRTVQDEFYRCERFHGLGDFLGKANTYVAYYNLKRRNRHRGNLSPFQIASSIRPGLSQHLFTPPPIILDLVEPESGGYHVPCPSTPISKSP